LSAGKIGGFCKSEPSFYRLLENGKLLIVRYLRGDLIAVPLIETVAVGDAGGS
jgi:hypothetical protein